MCLRKCLTKQPCESTGAVIFASATATTAAGDGILPLTLQSAQLRQRLMVWFTCGMGLAGNIIRIYSAHVTLKASARNSTRAQCAWDSGSVTVLVMDLLTRTPAGTQCPGSTWKKYLPYKLKKSRVCFIFVSSRPFKGVISI